MIKSHKESRKIPLSIGWLVTMTVTLFYMYEYFLRVAPSPMIDYFIAQFHLNLSDVGTIDGAYYWTYIPMQILVGTLMDQFGVRKPLFLAIITCILGSVLFGIDDSFACVIIGRVLMGFGSAFGFVAVLKTASVWLPKRHFPLAAGIATSVGMYGAIISLTLITKSITQFGVETTIDIAVIAGILLLVFSYFIVHDRKLASRSDHMGKRLQQIKKTFLSVITNSQIWLVGFIGLALFLPTQLFSGLWGIPYFVHIKHYTPELASQLSALLFWGWIIGAPLAGFIAEYVVTDERMLLLLSTLSCAVIAFVMIYMDIQDYSTYAILIFVLGLCSSFEILVFDYAVSQSRRSCAGTAVAVTNMFVMLGGPMQRWVGFLIESSGEQGVIFTEVGFQKAFAIMPVLCLLAFFITFFLKEQTK